MSGIAGEERFVVEMLRCYKRTFGFCVWVCVDVLVVFLQMVAAGSGKKDKEVGREESVIK